MMSIREYFSNLYVQAQGDENKFDEVADLEQQVYEWYENEDDRFYLFCAAALIDLDAVEDMMNGSQEYSLTLWVWDMCDE